MKIITFTKNNQFQALLQFSDPVNAQQAKLVRRRLHWSLQSALLRAGPNFNLLAGTRWPKHLQFLLYAPHRLLQTGQPKRQVQ